MTVNEMEKLIVPVKDNRIRYYVKNSEIFRILHDTHLTLGHGGKNRMEKELNREDINSAEESFQEEDYDNDEEPFDIRTQYIQLPEETDDSPERTKSPEEQKVSAATSKEEDEYDLFGRSMTMQLRKMPELVALHLMQKMQQMVFNAKKQLIKAKNKTKVRVPPPETHNNLQSKKRVISPSPMPHKSSSQSTPMYKFETISPDDTGAEDNTDKFFYEYMITAEEEKRASQELASENLKQQLKRKGLKSIDPLEVKRSKD
ncbi:uncharacterized protein LOC125230123 isoform X3 [Leguminivora glycinivorella]|uniref:uncharacterized protein LOC125230123 isoform X3 n=1 Tax=Leguminivora glycinivorella TaxID=1035111 RepID=UPI00200CD16B|nr:uncharacterized protein LOC125230123 isoform X3 [Leguminivora glycinivorella]